MNYIGQAGRQGDRSKSDNAKDNGSAAKVHCLRYTVSGAAGSGAVGEKGTRSGDFLI
jgi:hypothetical protein